MLNSLESSLLRLIRSTDINERDVIEKRDKDLTYLLAVGFSFWGHLRHGWRCTFRSEEP